MLLPCLGIALRLLGQSPSTTWGDIAAKPSPPRIQTTAVGLGNALPTRCNAQSPTLFLLIDNNAGSATLYLCQNVGAKTGHYVAPVLKQAGFSFLLDQ